MQPSARPLSIWARPLLVGLIAIGLLAGAGVAVAAPATSPRPAALHVPPPADVAAPIVVPAPPAPWIMGPVESASPTVEPNLAPNLRPQVAAPAASVAKKPRVVTPKPAAKSKPLVKHVAVSYRGVYHLWIPALGLSRSISDWGCNGGTIPNRVEYWGCAGSNNLYLLGHAWGVFASIHDGYHSGALHVGLKAYYADRSGAVHAYRISQIRHVANRDYASWSPWAMASSSTRIITLQTCDGATSAYRILVRLVPA